MASSADAALAQSLHDDGASAIENKQPWPLEARNGVAGKLPEAEARKGMPPPPLPVRLGPGCESKTAFMETNNSSMEEAHENGLCSLALRLRGGAGIKIPVERREPVCVKLQNRE